MTFRAKEVDLRIRLLYKPDAVDVDTTSNAFACPTAARTPTPHGALGALLASLALRLRLGRPRLRTVRPARRLVSKVLPGAVVSSTHPCAARTHHDDLVIP